jgi:cobalamin 5'-phosphate synthase/cobalamin synthase
VSWPRRALALSGPREARALLAAVGFLTRIPLVGAPLLDGGDVARAGPAFPLVGAAIGAALGGTAAALAAPLSPLLAAAVAVTLATTLTGALHLDALADSGDALGAGSRERALAIMRDHAVGAYGAAALVLDLLLKTAALATLAADGHALRAAVAAGALSRLAPVALAAALPYARAEGGAGAALTRGGPPRALLAAALALVVAVGVDGEAGLVLAGAALALTAALGLGFRRWLGGVTGDTLGAATELSETMMLVLAVGLAGAR